MAVSYTHLRSDLRHPNSGNDARRANAPGTDAHLHGIDAGFDEGLGPVCRGHVPGNHLQASELLLRRADGIDDATVMAVGRVDDDHVDPCLLYTSSGGPIKFGPYWLDARLAVGGTAEVYVGRPIDPTATPRKLVVKRLLPQFAADPEGRTMFEREAALHAAVRHENVVQVYAYGVDGGEPWLAMELVDGCDLFRLLRRLSGDARTLGPAISAYLARELLRGLESAHSARDPSGQPMGIIHRDVTPSNVYLSADGRVKLGDFGIARSSSRATLRTTGSAALKGKFAYLSPEQVAGEVFDQRADLFSTAVVLTEMLLGHPLFAGSGQLAVLLAIRDCRIDSLREARASLPSGLFEVLERSLARDPANRFQTAAALSEALAPFAAEAATARGAVSYTHLDARQAIIPPFLQFAGIPWPGPRTSLILATASNPSTCGGW